MSVTRIQTYLDQVQQVIAQMPAETMQEVVDLLIDTAENGRKVFICGNGGSASTASHFACDLAKNTQVAGAPLFKVIALTDNVEMLTAWANDTDYSNVFAAQLKPLVEADDVLIGISCSGNSSNVVNALHMAQEAKAKTVGFTGDTGGKLVDLADIILKVPSPLIEQQEDIHLMLEHCICLVVREQLQQKYG